MLDHINDNITQKTKRSGAGAHHLTLILTTEIESLE